MDYTKELHHELWTLCARRLAISWEQVESALTEIERSHAEVEQLKGIIAKSETSIGLPFTEVEMSLKKEISVNAIEKFRNDGGVYIGYPKVLK